MPGSGQVEQVTVRFQADINQYVQGGNKVADLNKQIAAGADAAAEKVFRAAVKMQQEYAKLVKASGTVSMAQSNATAAMYKTAMAKDNAAYAALRLAAAQEKAVNSSNKSSSSMTNMGSALRGAIGQYLSLGIAISQVANVVKEGMDFNKFMEVSTTAFGVMMKSVDDAKAKMKELFDYAVSSPLTFKDVVSASRQLMAYGFSAKELIPTINTLGIVSKATGVQLGDMAYVYGTLRSQGRAYTRDLMQFAMRGIPIYEELAKVVGKPVAELQKMTEEGKISFKEVEQAFANMTTGTGRFAGFFDEYMKTYEGKMSMLTDVWQQAMGKLTLGVFEQLKPIIDDLTAALRENGDAFEEWGALLGKSSKDAYDGLKVVGTAVGPVLDMLKDALQWMDTLNWSFIIDGVGALTIALGALLAVGTGGTSVLLTGIIITFSKWITDSLKWISEAKTKAEELNKIVYARSDYRDAGASNNLAYASPDFSDVGSKFKNTVADAAASAASKVDEELEKMMDEFSKYADRYKKFQAEISGDRYAMVNYEFDKEMEIMRGKLAGNKQLQDQARKWLEEERDFRKKTIDLEIYWRERQLIESETTNWESISKQYSMYNPEDRVKSNAKYYGIPESAVTSDFLKVLDLRMEAAGSESESAAEAFTVLDSVLNKMIESAKQGMVVFKASYELDVVAKERQIDLTQQMLDDIEAIYAEKIAAFDMIATGSNPSFWNANKIRTTEAFAEGKNLQGMAGLAYGSLQNTGIGNIMEGYSGREGKMGTGMNVFLTAIQAAAGPMKLLVDFLIKIVTSSQPMMDVIAQITTSVTYALMPVIDMLATGFAWLFDSVIVPVGNMIIDVINEISSWFGGAQMNHLITTSQAKEMMERTEKLNKSFADLGDALNEVIDKIKSDISNTLSAIKDLFSSKIKSLQDLYEVGAISGAEYAQQSAAAYTESYDAIIDAYEAAGMSSSDAITTAINTLGSNLTGNGTTSLQSLAELLTQQLSSIQLTETIGTQLEKLKGLASGGGQSAFDALLASTQANISALPEGMGADLQTQLNAISDTYMPNRDEVMNARIDAFIQKYGTNFIYPSGYGFDINASDVLQSSAIPYDKKDRLLKRFGFATGTSNVPYDMSANIHKGEGIIPATFMDSIRKGDLSLSGGGGNGGNVNVVVNVAGSVKTERDLATSIATEIYRQRRSGLLTV